MDINIVKDKIMDMMCDVLNLDKSTLPKDISFQKGKLYTLSLVLEEINKLEQKAIE